MCCVLRGGVWRFAMSAYFDADLLSVTQTKMGPGLARVIGAVDSVAIGEIAAQATLAGAHVKNVGV